MAVTTAPKRPRWRSVLPPLLEVGLILGAYLAYLLVRAFLPPDAQAQALENAARVLALEEAGGFAREAAWQTWALTRGSELVLFFNWAYILAYWPAITIIAVITYIRGVERYRYYRTLMLLSLAIALPVFGTFPVAPPRMLPGFVDTIQVYGPSGYGGGGMAPYYNPYAAVPSFHFAWTLILGLLFLRSRPAWLKVLGVLYPTLHFFAIVLTGNHYFIDAMAGFVVALLSLSLYELFLHRQALLVRAGGMVSRQPRGHLPHRRAGALAEAELGRPQSTPRTHQP